MCLLPLLYPTTFIEEWLLVVEAVIVFGSGVAGLSVLTHTHTPPQQLTSQWKRKPSRTLHYAGLTILCSPPRTGFTWFHSRGHILLSTPVLNTHARPIHVLSVACSSTRELYAVHPHAGTVSTILTHWDFSWFLAHTASWKLCVFIHKL